MGTSSPLRTYNLEIELHALILLDIASLDLSKLCHTLSDIILARCSLAARSTLTSYPALRGATTPTRLDTFEAIVYSTQDVA